MTASAPGEERELLGGNGILLTRATQEYGPLLFTKLN